MPLPPKPYPASDVDRALWAEAERRQAIIDERWQPFLERALTAFYAPEVLARLSITDLSRNPALYAWRTLNTLHEDTPTVTALDTPREALDLTSTPELWALRQDAQLRAIGIGESLMRLDVRGGRVRYRVVGAECVEMEPDPDQPGEPVALRETRVRDLGYGPEWIRESWDPRVPSYVVEAYRPIEGGGHGWVDVTSEVWPQGGYPYVDDAGPMLPYVLIHAELHGSLRRPDRWMSLVAATLGSGAMHTWWIHGMRDCANPQPIAIDARPAGATVDPAAGLAFASGADTRRLFRDPSAFLLWKSENGTGGTVTTLASTMDPLAHLQAIDAYVAGALRDAGLGPTDEAPAKGVSGVAISISREALRRSQRQQRPAAEQADRSILALAARMARIATDPPDPRAVLLPTDPGAYSIDYHGIAPSTDEIRAVAERQRVLMDLGLTERWRAIMEVHPHLTASEAQAMADRIEGRMAEPAPTAPPAAPPPAPAPEPQAEDDAPSDGIDADLLEQIRETVEAVAEGEIPRASGLAMIEQVAPGQGEAILADAGRGFVPEADQEEAYAVLTAALAVEGMPEEARGLLVQLADMLGAD